MTIPAAIIAFGMFAGLLVAGKGLFRFIITVGTRAARKSGIIVLGTCVDVRHVTIPAPVDDAPDKDGYIGAYEFDYNGRAWLIKDTLPRESYEEPRIGAQYDIYVNPRNPQRSCSEKDAMSSDGSFSIVLGTVMFLVFYVIAKFVLHMH